jgi:phosphatidylserine/phosphatidylglycerophosphate/cardiolipin synthase-like enzyme
MTRCRLLLPALLLLSACGPGPLAGGISPHPPPLPAGDVRLAVEPDAGPQAVLSILAAARTSLWVEMYLLTDDAAIEALAERRGAGCDVRVILEPHPYQADGANQAAFDRLAAAGADVRWAGPGFAYTHAKLAVVDHARLLALTLNLTRAGLGGNREYAVVDDAPADVAAAEAAIAADLTGATTAAAAGSRVVLSPERSRAALAGLVAGAASALAVEMEELSDPAMVQALLDARLRGVAVTVVLPASGRSAATDAAAGRLLAAGADVRALAAPDVHAKAVVADGRRMYVGSANLTAGSLDANRELGLLLEDPAAVGTVAATIAADGAAGAPP